MSVKFYKKKNGVKSWYFVVTTQKYPRKQYKKSGFRTKQEAQDAEREYLNNLKSRKIKLNPERTTVKQILDNFIQHIEASNDYAKGTINNYKGYRKNHLEEFEYKTLDEITPSLIQDWVDVKSNSISPYVHNGCRKMLNSSFNYAIKNRLININPFTDMEKRYEPVVIRNRFSIDEFTRMYKTCKEQMPEYFGIFAIACLTGMRLGEYTALLVKDINFETGKINVLRQYTKCQIKKTKTRTSTRQLDMSPDLANVIKWHMETFNISSGYLFTGRYEDIPISPKCANDRFKKLLVLCGYDKNYMRVHDLRGQYVDIGHKLGLPVVYISRQVGHARTSTTTDIYSQILNDVGEEAKEKFTKLLCDKNVTD